MRTPPEDLIEVRAIAGFQWRGRYWRKGSVLTVDVDEADRLFRMGSVLPVGRWIGPRGWAMEISA